MENGKFLMVISGVQQHHLTLNAVPAGLYTLEWIDPATGTQVNNETINWPGGDLTLTTPEYDIDIAFRIKVQQ